MSLQEKRAYFPTNRTKLNSFLFFTHAHKPKFGPSLPICFDLFFSLSFVAHFIVFLLYGIVAGEVIRKETNLIFKE